MYHLKNTKPNDKKYNKYKFLTHDYFLPRLSIKLDNGGVIAFITQKEQWIKKIHK